MNKINKLNIMVEDTNLHINGITESWANKDIADAELVQAGYIMFMRDRRRKKGVLFYIVKNLFRLTK